MTPLTFITGVLLGTAASISFGLAVVMLLFLLMGTSEPRVVAEWSDLTINLVIFLVMTTICAVSFISLVRQRPWRWAAQAGMWLGVAATLVYYLT